MRGRRRLRSAARPLALLLLFGLFAYQRRSQTCNPRCWWMRITVVRDERVCQHLQLVYTRLMYYYLKYRKKVYFCSLYQRYIRGTSSSTSGVLRASGGKTVAFSG